LTGCEQGNTYNIFPLGKDGDKKGKKLFKAKEKSSCFSKQCLTGDCRPFKLEVKLSDDNESLDGEHFLRLDRPCQCTVLCWNRPELNVYYVEDGKDEFIGKIVNPFLCCACNLINEIYDKHGNKKFVVDGSCCQLGLWCKGYPCSACETIDFDLKNPTGEVISNIKKKSPGCLKAAFSDADNFAIHFPKGATSEDKALIMAATLFMDYRYFEEKAGGNQGMY
jgi:hypothetical protein